MGVLGSTPTGTDPVASRPDAMAPNQHKLATSSTSTSQAQAQLAAPTTQGRDISSKNTGKMAMASQAAVTIGTVSSSDDAFPRLPVSLHPKCFLLRAPTSPTAPGHIVPLIPLDLLPDHIQIVGLPRHLSPRHVAGMANLGTIPSTADGAVYKLRIVSDDDGVSPTAPCRLSASLGETADSSDNTTRAGVEKATTTHLREPTQPKAASEKRDSFRSSSFSSSDPSPSPSSSPCSPARDLPTVTPVSQQHPADRMLQAQAMTDAEGSRMPPQTSAERWKSSRYNGKTSNSTSQNHNHCSNGSDHDGNTSSNNSSNTNNNNNKNSSNNSSNNGQGSRLLCRHWCHHGTCWYGLYCRFQHTMPTTLEGLQELGMKELPPWFQSAMRLTLDEWFATGMNTPGAQRGSVGQSHQPPGSHYMPGNGLGGGGMGAKMGVPVDMRMAAAMVGRGGVNTAGDLFERKRQLQARLQQRDGERERESQSRRIEEREMEKAKGKETREMERVERLEKLGILHMDKITAGTDGRKDRGPEKVVGNLLDI
ncbi:hypothetical protein SODALDRAFT_331963 [Sodiomyces alkalinus F11]|uniref:C3H1-type domain-containing protein n=1 Tax=Sodiomyces alkalinus (strain CBS 110278 / VKM F-3762 / F11) TaxID=1314773 RepID=A0A3N2PZH4_SODAK|nr:hypothetical protein SODALDRAFT_331963 [Sodiomyces alkalinus F11]ROT39836.1 hypothetical protein SODALDRAFT_331963 [Sodiomyces alkalinus F11]